MTKIFAAIAATAFIASTSIAMAGGLNESVKEDKVRKAAGPVSSFPVWLPLVIAAGAAAASGGTSGTGGTTTPPS